MRLNEIYQGGFGLMDDTIDVMYSDEKKDEELMELYNKSFKELQEGQIVSGEVVHIDRDREFALVDIGYKTEGVIPIKEFINKKGEVTIKVGDKIDALLVQKDEEKNLILLSKEKARQIKSWNMIEDAFKNNGVIKGCIKARTKGGFFVDINGVQAFLPGSQLDFRPVKNWNTFIGTEHEFMVIKLDKYKKNIVISRKALLEYQKETMRKETMARLKEGAVLEGKVKSVTDYGLFVDLGGVDGLVHITDISWGRITNPPNLYKPGDQVKVKVLKFDKGKDRISLGIKQLTPDPWTDAEKKYPIGARIKAKVTGLKDYGAFVELEPGVEGLIHVSEMSWTKKIRHPSQMVEVGDLVDVVVLDINVPKRRIALGMRQVEPNPWDIVEEKYPVGTVLKGKVRSVTDFGVFVGVEEGIDGLVHVSDISWSKKRVNPLEMFKVGDEVEAIVLSIDRQSGRFSLGIKQLAPNPWEVIAEKYSPGSTIKGTITSITDFGIFVEIEDGIEGLVHVSEIPKGSSLSQYKVGEQVEAKVINVFPKDKKIGLSLQRLEEKREKDRYKSYISRQQFKSSLGEILKEEIKNLKLDNIKE